MAQTTDSMSQLDEGAKLGWKAASELMAPFGAVASNFCEAIRVLISAYSSESPAMSQSMRSHIYRLLRSDTVKATYYFFCKQFKTDIFVRTPPITEKEFFDAFTPIDHAAILTFCYLFKNLSKKVEKDEWEYVQTPLYEALAIGARVGQTIQEVGVGIGLLSRGIRYLSFAAFMRENRKAFKEYRRHLKTNDITFDQEFEQSVWQCSSIQIAGLLLERMGFPRVVALQLIAAAEHDTSVEADPKFGIPFRIAECLLEAYMEGHEVPTSMPNWVGKDVRFTAESRGSLLAALNNVVSDKNRIEWLNKGSSDISATNTPELFVVEEPPKKTVPPSAPL